MTIISNTLARPGNRIYATSGFCGPNIGYWECVEAPSYYEHDGKWAYHELQEPDSSSPERSV